MHYYSSLFMMVGTGIIIVWAIYYSGELEGQNVLGLANR